MASAPRRRLLCIDDSIAQLELYKLQLADEYDLALARSYQEAIACLSTQRPDLILLDMVMPDVSGLEFLDILRFSQTFREIEVIIISGDHEATDIRAAFRKGAIDYIRKPYDDGELSLRINRIFRLRPPAADRNGAPERDSEPARALMIQSLADLAATRDNETGQHLVRMTKYVGLLSLAAAKSEYFGSSIDADFLELIGSLSVLHDIGKVSIPDLILQKPGRLTPEEFEIMKTHTTKGADTIDRIHRTFPSYSFLDFARAIIIGHHERWDGSGYPAGLAGTDISLQARIVAIADVFDALTMTRVYKPAMPVGEAFAQIAAGGGTHFDPRLTELFLGVRPEAEAIHERYADAH